VKAPINLIGRANAVLQVVSASEPLGVSTTEAALGAGLARPTAHRILVALQAEGLLDRNDLGVWVLGPEIYLLGSVAAGRYDVTALAQPVVRQLSVASAESAFFSARRGDETVCLIREDGSFPVRSHVLREGIRFPLGCVSAGMAILAYLPPGYVDDLLRRIDLTMEFGPSFAEQAVRERIGKTRQVGYAVNPGLVVPGSWGLSAAVFDAAGEPRWALTLTGIEQRFTSVRQKELGEMLLRAAHDLGDAIRRRPS